MAVFNPGFRAEVPEFIQSEAGSRAAMALISVSGSGSRTSRSRQQRERPPARLPIGSPVPRHPPNRKRRADLGTEQFQHLRVVDKQADIKREFVSQLACQSPTDADITKVINCSAEDVPDFSEMWSILSECGDANGFVIRGPAEHDTDSAGLGAMI